MKNSELTLQFAEIKCEIINKVIKMEAQIEKIEKNVENLVGKMKNVISEEVKQLPHFRNSTNLKHGWYRRTETVPICNMGGTTVPKQYGNSRKF